jgi:hypothetical protein
MRRIPTQADKETIHYWWRRIRHPTSVYSNGRRHRQRNWAVELHWHGKHLNWTLDTHDRDLAAERAREIYQYLVIYGWDAMKRKYRPDEQS